MHSTFGHPHHMSKKLWFEEYDKIFLNKESPGPAQYEPKVDLKSTYSNSIQHSFGKTPRNILIQENRRKSKYLFM